MVKEIGIKLNKYYYKIKEGKKMKKNVFYFGIILCAFVLTSCVSLPKKAKAGDTLVIGQVTVTGHGYKVYKEQNDLTLNGFHTDNIEVTIAEWNSGKEKKMIIPNDGYFYWTGLKANETYIIKKVEYKVTAPSGAWVNVWIDKVTNMSFTPAEDTVVNIGLNHFDFNGTSNWCEWNRNYWGDVERHFISLDVESEWLEKNIVTQ